jgi:hypothetical protein
MKSKQEILSKLYAVLAELQSKTAGEELTKILKIQLELLYDILDEDIPEEFWAQIEKEL